MALSQNRSYWNRVRYNPESKKGHYESYFFRANHPDRPLGFWVRYTIFSPKGEQGKSIGELWSIFFDGEKGQISAAKSEHPMDDCSFSAEGLAVRIAESSACDGQLAGAISKPNQLRWNLKYESDQQPLLLLQESSYEKSLPKAKALVGAPLAMFSGNFSVNGNRYEIDGWPGSENHNWGEKHTDQYAWGQVSGFDDNPDVFLEVITGKIKVGPLLSPSFTMLVLRVDGVEYQFNRMSSAFRAKGKYDFFEWHFRCKNDTAEVEGTIQAPRENFVGLTYYNPPGGNHTCLNSKIAACQLNLTLKDGAPLTFTSANRAAFEILTDRKDHGVEVPGGLHSLQFGRRITNAGHRVHPGRPTRHCDSAW